MKNRLLIACIVYTIFVIYGSLVPWQFNSLSPNEAWYRFQNIEYFELGIASRADWVANILLFIPLAFLWLCRLSLQQKLIGKLVASAAVLIACFLLCSVIEFTQLYFPPRTVSLNDIVAESLGAVLGVFSWWILGKKFIAWLENWQINKTDTIPYLQVYLGCMFFYNVLPLDLTLSPVEFYHKWREGRVILVPFSGITGDIFRDIYDCLSDIALWIPVPWLWHKLGNFSKRDLLKRVLVSAALIEFFQLFVYSRVTDITDILLAWIGGLIGVSLIGISFKDNVQDGGNAGLKSPGKHYFLYVCLGYLLWALVVVLVFWYPYDFKFSYANFLAWSDRFLRLPFYAYYYGTEFRAITEVFHKVLFFIPFGVILSGAVQSVANKVPAIFFVVLGTGVTSLGIEFGQLFLPNKNPDSTDVILEILGGFLGFVLAKQLMHHEASIWKGRDSQISYSASVSPSPKENLNRDPIFISSIKSKSRGVRNIELLLASGSVAAVFGVLIFLSISTEVPYNVRELFSENFPIISALGVALLMYWCFSYPLYSLINEAKKNKLDGLFYVRFVAIQSLGAWLLVRSVIPMESIHDILGSPILSIPAEVELIFRFFALFSIFSLMILGAAHAALFWIVSSREFFRLFLLGFFWATLLLSIDYWIVVVEAATDNLTELMANNGYSFLVLSICIYFFLVGWLGSSISLHTVFSNFRRLIIVSLLFVLSFPLGYQLLNWGTEQFIIKYDSVFSAMQFLLSRDRSHLVSGETLRQRFFIMHAGFVIMIYIAQVPVAIIFTGFSRAKRIV